ncbi:uncharacterized protein UV8b_06732 [Ustilaginoidea virens]|uniref:Mmc1 C-terminal domain-containing protein n=1 Tax=Ustilaginoidea virens TaxID=1159556 RepID=A0A8E5MK47_USTVR|nr:uncharacterized protein UV8b_06732 [Ustilaginoidea virens]QUC22491.1 hypothetical protein UV8b_06732 [Ustilaginoidea virens]
MAPSSRPLARPGQYRLLCVPSSRLASIAHACPTCASAALRRRRDAGSRRHHSNAISPRVELEKALLQLQKKAPHLTDTSRLQLALQGLRAAAGEELVRVAILGLGTGSHAGPTARRLVRAILADPLQDEQPWEKELESCDGRRPLVVRVGPPRKLHAVSLVIEREKDWDEMHVSSPQFDDYNLEFILIEGNQAPGDAGLEGLLVPAADIRTAAGRSAPAPAPLPVPVHQALAVADGFRGAVSVSLLPVSLPADMVNAAVQMEGVTGQQLKVPFPIVDVSLAERGVGLFRQGPQHAMEYERLWSSSNVPALTRWLKDGATSAAGATKPAVRNLVGSLLQNTLDRAQLLVAQSSARDSAGTLAGTLVSGDRYPGVLGSGPADWAQRAHTELQEELDLAFSGRRWRKLGWWKLFWRVDDVAMLANEMLCRRFLPTAEQELVYLAGRVAQTSRSLPEYPQPASAARATRTDRPLASGERAPAASHASFSALPKWPGHVAFARRYLQNETVPALQSLAQKLVLQALGTSATTTSLAALLYISSLSSTVYDAAAVAALGIVYGLGRLQRKWNAARAFWEGEVREEGRKAVRAAEESLATALKNHASKKAAQGLEGAEEAKQLVAKAQDALAKMK